MMSSVYFRIDWTYTPLYKKMSFNTPRELSQDLQIIKP